MTKKTSPERSTQPVEKTIIKHERQVKFRRFDVADYLLTQEDIDAFLEACIEDDPGDGSLIKLAREDIARATSRINAKQ
ncbi:DNA-binding protein [Pseudomonas palleroniana]|uniref:helix-turn-helix domain-containing transcriptional regulator n=1 Tax=Pseudomonas palleroniana TaxID=191390 RepID=UPI0018E66D50|nr:hypothetical protein [Pseudomonas palleroniana]MBI6907660.1 hypothetical protein [Pseudomonas palleroniana]